MLAKHLDWAMNYLFHILPKTIVENHFVPKKQTKQFHVLHIVPGSTCTNQHSCYKS